jgi:hypothetical protein
VSLCGGHITCTDQPYPFVAIRVGDNDEPLPIRVSGCQKSILFRRVIWIVDSQCKRIPEYSRSLFERDPVLDLVLVILFWIPFELHPVSVYAVRSPWTLKEGLAVCHRANDSAAGLQKNAAEAGNSRRKST